MSKVLEGTDKAIHDSLISKDKFWVEMMESRSHYLKSMYFEQINMGKTLGSMFIREAKLVKSNVKMLDWAMATDSGKKKKNQPQKSSSLTTSLMSFSLLMSMLS